jgi:phospholipase C
MKRFRRWSLTAALVAAAVPLALGASSHREETLRKIDHFVVVFQENHSFDNLYGGWERVRGRGHADRARTAQVTQAGVTYDCLFQTDVNLTSPPLTATCAQTAGPAFTSAFVNAPFPIEAYIAPEDRTCPPPGGGARDGTLRDSPGALPGGCTRDLEHRFYQEQYQLNGGRMNRYATGSDAAGLVMGYYDTARLPLYVYLHAPDHPSYAIADDFHQAAFGGSFLNHQWLIAAATPVLASAAQSGDDDLHSVVDQNGMPRAYPGYAPATAVKDRGLTVTCPAPLPHLACGDYAANTMQPWSQPYRPRTPDRERLGPLPGPTIGQRLTAAGIDWAWYSGGWSNANGERDAPGWTNGPGPSCADPDTAKDAAFPHCPHGNFQFHHQPFNYFAAFDPGTSAGLAARRAHLRDEAEFRQILRASTAACQLKPVSFVKLLGSHNEHPGYASVHAGNARVVELVDMIVKSPCAADTMIVLTYDEFGGQWDHMPPPGQGNQRAPHDIWGPGTRVPALIVAPFLQGRFVVDPTPYDTTSIIATLRKRYGLPALGPRDAAVADLSHVFDAR